jgi:hypothetical protein
MYWMYWLLDVIGVFPRKNATDLNRPIPISVGPKWGLKTRWQLPQEGDVFEPMMFLNFIRRPVRVNPGAFWGSLKKDWATESCDIISCLVELGLYGCMMHLRHIRWNESEVR